MRKEMSLVFEREAKSDKKIIFITGDLGFMSLENVQNSIGKRFVNAGVSEQNMISLAAGMASQGLKPVCYSIAPFAVFRPAEQIRLDVCLHNMNVKIVGNGGGYGYGIMGATHHAIEDIAVLSSFQNMKCYIPFCNEDTDAVIVHMLKRAGPGYLRLGYGVKPESLKIPAYKPVRKLLDGKKVTVAALGPMALNVYKAAEAEGMKSLVDLFVVSEIPFGGLEIIESVRKTGKLIVVEEHVGRGGLGEYLSLILLKNKILCGFKHHCAVGYPEGRYGSQAYHQKKSGLDADNLRKSIIEIIHE